MSMSRSGYRSPVSTGPKPAPFRRPTGTRLHRVPLLTTCLFGLFPDGRLQPPPGGQTGADDSRLNGAVTAGVYAPFPDLEKRLITVRVTATVPRLSTLTNDGKAITEI